MSIQDVILDPKVSAATVLTCLEKLFGFAVHVWEPDTIRVSLKRKFPNHPESLIVKALAAITIKTTNVWTYDHDVLFAFALAECGIGASSDSIHHPTVEQLVWAVDEIQFICGAAISDDAGFDQDTVDPAIAAILFDEGYIIAPNELRFVQEKLDGFLVNTSDNLQRKTDEAWRHMATFSLEEQKKKINALEESPLKIQLGRLWGCRAYAQERRLLRTTHHGILTR